MLRRRFLVSVAALVGWVMGCRRQPAPAPTVYTTRPVDGRLRSESELIVFVRDRIRSRMAIQTTFDPITILALVGFVMRVVQVCQTAQILRLQTACRSKPEGGVARRLKAKLHARFAMSHPDISEASINDHVDAAVEAFVDAGTAELLAMKQDLDRLNSQPTEIELKLFTDHLSQP